MERPQTFVPRVTPKDLVLCFDGTNNKFGPNNTNVIRLVDALDRNAHRLYYDPGVGTLPEPSWHTQLGQKWSVIKSWVVGAGLTEKVETAYQFLMNYWEPGARVFMFGFSRGAYTARVLAGMLYALGLPSRGNGQLVPHIMRLFDSIRGDPTRHGQKQYFDLCNEFRETFGRESGRDDRRFSTHFLGLWDTVSSVGWAWEPRSFPYTFKNAGVSVIRQAIALDERRSFFRQNRMQLRNDSRPGEPIAPPQDLLQVWFAGVHADIGGGYEKNPPTWRPAFDWMVREAAAAGLKFDAQRLNALAPAGQITAGSTAELHESLVGAWKLAEYVPKWRPGRKRYEANRGKSRTINAGEFLDRTVLVRLRETAYAPPNLTPAFVAAVRAIDAAKFEAYAGPMAYRPDGQIQL